MKAMYVITLEMDEDSVYFTELTERQADQLRGLFRRCPWKFSVRKIKGAPGYTTFSNLVADFAGDATR